MNRLSVHRLLFFDLFLLVVYFILDPTTRDIFGHLVGCKSVLRIKYKTVNWSLQQGDEQVDKRIKQKNIFFIYQFFFYSLFTCSSPCPRAILPFYILYKLLLYWSRSATVRSGTTQRFVAVDLLIFNILESTTNLSKIRLQTNKTNKTNQQLLFLLFCGTPGKQ